MGLQFFLWSGFADNAMDWSAGLSRYASKHRKNFRAEGFGLLELN